MELKTGDKVKFLNEKGGGIVTRIISKELVHVAIEEGFEIPTLIKDLVVIGRNKESAERLFDQEFSINTSAIKKQKVDEQAPPAYAHNTFEGKAMEDGIWLAYIPHQQQLLVSGPLDIVIFNNASFRVAFQIYRKKERQLFIHAYGVIKPASAKVIATIEREALPEWVSGTIQMMFQIQKTDKVPVPASVSFNLKPSRFYHDNSYIQCSLAKEKILPVMLKSNTGIVSTTTDDAQMIEDTRVTFRSGSEIIKEYIKNDGRAVVDLHIHNITDEHRHINQGEALKIQLSYFSKVLESAIRMQVQRLILIHGVGNGILKSEIRKYLDEYDFIHYFDAPIALYGLGATEATIFYGKQH
ncbi:MAG: DUF2027 domain-containing protein [Bacteroidales bacterium]|nr:DUF2027 domain-containing protein [Bacteroidales bacterium]